ncbi:MAG: serine kinase [Proteobacteria bacterium]|nr:serine kinase [Pseudomonadota bacterium]
MKRTNFTDPTADPFAERRRPALRRKCRLLGGDFVFETDSPQLLRIVGQAYGALPRHTLGRPPSLRVRLRLEPRSRRPLRGDPPLLGALAAPGMCLGALDGSGFAVIVPRERSALISVPRSMLRFPYHLRYELIEFAVYMLAARVQQLVPLHAACVGLGGRGVLLLGPSGAGKSTLALGCLLRGFDFLAEDSVLAEPATLRATGIANYIHVRRDALRFVDDRGMARELGRAATIRRRSGVRKLEIDLRQGGLRLARAPLQIAAAVFVSADSARPGKSLLPLRRRDAIARLAAEQPYAAAQPGWRAFARAAARIPAYELRRSGPPRDGITAIENLLRQARRR